MLLRERLPLILVGKLLNVVMYCDNSFSLSHSETLQTEIITTQNTLSHDC